MAYSFYHKNLFEILAILFGIGGNGRYVFAAFLSVLLGSKNVSNIPLRVLSYDGFGSADLIGKNIKES